jgi:hypothetical protein
MGNAIVHVEIPVTSLEKAREFYSKVFGWKIYEKSGFTLFESGAPIGGSFNKVDTVKGGGCLLYIAVDDIEKKLQEIEQAGGKILRRKTEILGEGWDALFEDIFGNVFYLFTPRKKTV